MHYFQSHWMGTEWILQLCAIWHQTTRGQARLARLYGGCTVVLFIHSRITFSEQTCQWTGPPRYVGVHFLLVECYSRLSVPHRAKARAHCPGLTSHTERKKHKIRETRNSIVLFHRIHRCDMLCLCLWCHQWCQQKIQKLPMNINNTGSTD